MVELRKRPGAPSDPLQPPQKKASTVSKMKSKPPPNEASPSANGTGKAQTVLVGKSIDLEEFGGEVETQSGQKTTLKELVIDSKSGVVLFTYPKASTPGCTTQACLFRDEFSPLTATGYSIFGLSTDSPKSNTTFKAKQNLPYTLLCDPGASLIAAIGMKKSPKGTTRGVFVIGKDGKVQAVEPGGPAATVDVVRKLVQNTGAPVAEDTAKIIEAEVMGSHEDAEADNKEPGDAGNGSGAITDEPQADVAAQVADTAEKLDGDASLALAWSLVYSENQPFAMATNAAKGAGRQLASSRGSFSYLKKYTVQSTGIWDRIRRLLAVDPNRSSGVPLNPQFRNPPPGANPPEAYDDPITVPAGDIAENAYFRRDMRRSYPRLSVVKQGDVVGLLTVGSQAKPKENILQIGDAGTKQLMQVQQEGEDKGLAALFEREITSVANVLGANGMPPFPTGASRVSPDGGRRYVMDIDREEGFPEQ
ncbi:MAG: hypothetical protein Q9208_002999 [Pyrenodesmia sp. 3 TL-2023]